MMKTMNTLRLCALLVAAGLTLGACSNDDDDNGIKPAQDEHVMHPIQNHLVGRWTQVVGSRLMDDGHWEDRPADADRFIITYRPDGTCQGIITGLDGWQLLHEDVWEVDDAQNMLYHSPADTCKVVRLNEDKMVLEFVATAIDSQTGELVYGPYRGTYVPHTGMTPAEKLAGRWRIESMYYKQDGVWEDWVLIGTDGEEIEEIITDLSQTGEGTIYYDGFIVSNVGTSWQVHPATSRMRLVSKEFTQEYTYELTENCNHLSLYYTEKFGLGTYERRDELVRIVNE